MTMDNYWTKCWKCRGIIKTKEQCYYVHCRAGKYNYCETCYNEFLSLNNAFFQFERSRSNELKSLISNAIDNYHEKHHKGELHNCTDCTQAFNLCLDGEEKKILFNS